MPLRPFRPWSSIICQRRSTVVSRTDHSGLDRGADRVRAHTGAEVGERPVDRAYR